MALTESIVDECSMDNIESCPSAQSIKELLVTLHKLNQSQKFQSEIPSALHQHVHHFNSSNDIQSPSSKVHPMPNLLHSLSEEQLTESVIATVSGDEKTSDDEVEYAKSPSVDFEKMYSVIPLLDALNHLKCDHGVDEHDDEFDKIFAFFEASMTGNHCDVNDCEHVKRHYSDRRRRQLHIGPDHDHVADHEREQLLDTIAMIHCYFVHSFDIDRLTKEERERVNQEGNDEHEKMTVITNILIEKRKNLKYVPNGRRGDDQSEMENDQKTVVDFVSMAETVGMDEEVLSGALNEYKKNRNRLIHDLIDVVYAEEEQKTNIWDKLEMEDKEKMTIFRSVLFDHFKCNDLNNKNCMKMSEYIIERKAFGIDHDELLSVMRRESVDGKAFVQMEANQFGALFKMILDNADVGKLYTALSKWQYVESAVPDLKKLPSARKISPMTTMSVTTPKSPTAMGSVSLVGAVIEIGI